MKQTRRGFLKTATAAMTAFVAGKLSQADAEAEIEVLGQAVDGVYAADRPGVTGPMGPTKQPPEMWEWGHTLAVFPDDPILDLQREMANAARITLEKELGIYVG